jgi:hypothetical protein
VFVSWLLLVGKELRFWYSVVWLAQEPSTLKTEMGWDICVQGGRIWLGSLKASFEVALKNHLSM